MFADHSKDGSEALLIDQVLTGIERHGGKQAKRVPRSRLKRLAHKYDKDKDGKLEKDELKQLLEYLESGHEVQEELAELSLALEVAEQKVEFYEQKAARRDWSTSVTLEIEELQSRLQAGDY